MQSPTRSRDHDGGSATGAGSQVTEGPIALALLHENLHLKLLSDGSRVEPWGNLPHTTYAFFRKWTDGWMDNNSFLSSNYHKLF